MNSEDYSIISVMGPYARESEDSIFKRKIQEIKTLSYTYWHHQSYQAKPNMVQELAQAAKKSPIKLYLISTGTLKRGDDTKIHPQAKRYSINKNGPYTKIPEQIYVETGTRPWALVIRNLKMVNDQIDLWDYTDFFTKNAIRTKQGGSTLCAIKQSSRNDPNKMKSNIRDIVATAEVIEPFSVWLSS